MMRNLGAALLPGSAIGGIALIVFGVVERTATGLAIAGAILVGSALVAVSLSRR